MSALSSRSTASSTVATAAWLVPPARARERAIFTDECRKSTSRRLYLYCSISFTSCCAGVWLMSASSSATLVRRAACQAALILASALKQSNSSASILAYKGQDGQSGQKKRCTLFHHLPFEKVDRIIARSTIQVLCELKEHCRCPPQVHIYAVW